MRETSTASTGKRSLGKAWYIRGVAGGGGGAGGVGAMGGAGVAVTQPLSKKALPPARRPRRVSLPGPVGASVDGSVMMGLASKSKSRRNGSATGFDSSFRKGWPEEASLGVVCRRAVHAGKRHFR